jgi:exo-1,4-beta-D-glucosaminidase
VTAEIYDAQGQRQHQQTAVCDAPANASTTALTLPELDKISTTYFLRLTALDSAGKVRSVNSYWLSTKPDVLDFSKSDWNITPMTSFADYTQLEKLPKVNLEVEPIQGAKSRDDHASSSAHVRVTNRSDAIALLVRLKLVHGDDGKQEVLPIFWSDNYFMLLPGEKREISARFAVQPQNDLKIPTVVVDCFNNGRG